jgi:CheY-like chemotaxis protein
MTEEFYPKEVNRAIVIENHQLETKDNTKRLKGELSTPSPFSKVRESTMQSGICRCKTVLVVEDNEFQMSALMAMMNLLGFTTMKAFDGRAAVELVKSMQEPKKRCSEACKFLRLIIIDMSLPVMSGADCAKVLTDLMERKEIAEVPMVCCLEYLAEGDMDRCYLAGFSEILHKPIELENLRLLLQNY